MHPRASFHSKAALFCVLGRKGERYELHTEKGVSAGLRHHAGCRQPAPAADFAEAAQGTGERINAEK